MELLGHISPKRLRFIQGLLVQLLVLLETGHMSILADFVRWCEYTWFRWHFYYALALRSRSIPTAHTKYFRSFSQWCSNYSYPVFHLVWSQNTQITVSVFVCFRLHAIGQIIPFTIFWLSTLVPLLVLTIHCCDDDVQFFRDRTAWKASQQLTNTVGSTKETHERVICYVRGRQVLNVYYTDAHARKSIWWWAGRVCVLPNGGTFIHGHHRHNHKLIFFSQALAWAAICKCRVSCWRWWVPWRGLCVVQFCLCVIWYLTQPGICFYRTAIHACAFSLYWCIVFMF